MPKTLSEDDITARRERLIDAAERLFAQHGPDGVSMRQLAAELGVSPMTPYGYFKDKDAILAAARARSFLRFAEALEGAFAAGGDAGERARRVGEAYVTFAFQHPAAYRLMFDLAQPSEADYPELVAAAKRARATMTQYTEGLLQAGFLVGDAEVIARVFWAAVHGLVVLKLADKLGPEVAFETLIEEMFRALNTGFARKP